MIGHPRAEMTLKIAALHIFKEVAAAGPRTGSRSDNAVEERYVRQSAGCLQSNLQTT